MTSISQESGSKTHGNASSWPIWVGAALGVLMVCLCLGVAGYVVCRRLAARGTTILGADWMVLPSYQPAHRSDVENPVPVYNELVGDDDAGHYDENGNFVAKQTSKSSSNHVEKLLPAIYVDECRSPSPEPLSAPARPAPAQRRSSDSSYESTDASTDSLLVAR